MLNTINRDERKSQKVLLNSLIKKIKWKRKLKDFRIIFETGTQKILKTMKIIIF